MVARTIFVHQDFPDQPSDWLDGRADKCEHIEALEVYHVQLMPY